MKKLTAIFLAMCILFGCVACDGQNPAADPEETTAAPTTSTAAPTDPATPTNPDDPEQPTDPDDLEQPTNPDDPEQPTNPDDPEQPTDPDDPSQPADPSDPTDPDEPDVPVITPETDPEKIFNKTIHDFDGYRVDKLDDQEDTNFVVYAKGYRELNFSATRNVLQAVDADTLTYTFNMADDAMKALKSGDVFFIGVSELTPSGDTVKVKSIEIKGDTAVIHGDEVSMEDIYVYMDVDMSLDSIPVDNDQSAIPTRSITSGANQVPLEDRVFWIPLLGSAGTTSGAFGTSISGSGMISGGLKNTKLTIQYSFLHRYFAVQLDSQ